MKKETAKLYLKTHNKTGMKYLGITTGDTINSYKGSGAEWKKHIKEHGKHDVTTEILYEEPLPVGNKTTNKVYVYIYVYIYVVYIICYIVSILYMYMCVILCIFIVFTSLNSGILRCASTTEEGWEGYYQPTVFALLALVNISIYIYI